MDEFKVKVTQEVQDLLNEITQAVKQQYENAEKYAQVRAYSIGFCAGIAMSSVDREYAHEQYNKIRAEFPFLAHQDNNDKSYNEIIALLDVTDIEHFDLYVTGINAVTSITFNLVPTFYVNHRLPDFIPGPKIPGLEHG